MAKQQRKRAVPKVLSKRARGMATAHLMRMNGAFKKAGLLTVGDALEAAKSPRNKPGT